MQMQYQKAMDVVFRFCEWIISLFVFKWWNIQIQNNHKITPYGDIIIETAFKKKKHATMTVYF